jgi:murein DD-endopeptidase MepM/ murein hydrolase activator NlpD
MKPWIVGTALTAILGFAGNGAPAETRQGVDAAVQSVPVLALTGTGQVLRYELRLTNFNKAPLTLTGVRIVDGRSGRALGIVTGQALIDALRPVRSDKPDKVAVLQPGRTNLLFIDLPVAPGAGPANLLHRLILSEGSNEFEVEGAATAVRPAPQSNLGPPLKGGPWVAVYEPSMDGGHRRVLYATSGRATIPGRFAIDWFRADERGHQIRGTGAPVLAVADGVIAAARDDFADPTPTSKPVGPELDNDTGNYVALRIAAGKYVFYEHLKHGLRVKAGERVRRGQVLGFVGSTGHVTGPHLHFHVAAANSPLGSEGVPYGFRRFELVGRYQSIFAFDRGDPWQPASGTGSGLPGPNTAVRFPL